MRSWALAALAALLALGAAVGLWAYFSRPAPAPALTAAAAPIGALQHSSIRSGGLSHSFPGQAVSGPVFLRILPTLPATVDQCTGSAVTGTRGQAVTVTRAASATCTRTDATTATVTANQPNSGGNGLDAPASTTVSVANPLSILNGFCLNVTAMAASRGHWPTGAGAYVLFNLGQFATNNSITAYFDDNRRIVLNTKSGDGTSRTYTELDQTVFTGPRRISVCLPSTNVPAVYLDGIALTQDSSTAISLTAQPSTLYIGGQQAGFGFAMSFVDFCVGRTLADCSATALSRPTATKKVACLGDSITAGGIGSVSTPWPQKVEQLMASSLKQADNYGVSGAKAADTSTRYTNFVAGKGYTHATVLIGVNDMLAGTTAATAYATISALFDTIRAAGIALTPLTVMPFKNASGWTSGKQTQLASLNTSILGYCTTNSITCVDAYALMGDTDPTALKAAYDSGDGLHPNQTGANALATAVEAVVDP